MTPKEKAIEIYNKFRNENSVMTANIRAKKQALICVKEIIYYMSGLHDSVCYNNANDFWEEVKEELQKL